MRRFTRLTGALLALLLVFSVLSGCGGAASGVPSSTAAPAADAVSAADAPSDAEADAVSPGESDKSSPAALDEGGEYTSAEDVALYLHLYAHLPQNFIAKKDARRARLERRRAGRLRRRQMHRRRPVRKLRRTSAGRARREYHECDIDTLHAASRGAKRIVYSNDGLIYYTEDHYESFILLYGEE